MLRSVTSLFRSGITGSSLLRPLVRRGPTSSQRASSVSHFYNDHKLLRILVFDSHHRGNSNQNGSNIGPAAVTLALVTAVCAADNHQEHGKPLVETLNILLHWRILEQWKKWMKMNWKHIYFFILSFIDKIANALADWSKKDQHPIRTLISPF